MMNFRDPTLNPHFLANIVDGVAPSPYAQLLEDDYDGTTSGMIEMLTRLASQRGDVSPREAAPPPGVTTGDSDPEQSTLTRGAEIFGTILKAPFRLLGAGVEGLQDALGAPASQHRETRQQYLDNVDRLGLATSALTAEQKAALGYTPDMVFEQPRKPGIWEVINGNARKEEARKAARVAAVKRAIEMNFGGARIASENMQALKSGADARKSYLEGNEVAPNSQAWRAVRAAERLKELAGAGAEDARAGKERAQAGLYGAQTAGEWQDQRLNESGHWQSYGQKDRAFEQDYDQKNRAFELTQTQLAQGFRNKEQIDADELAMKERANEAYIRGLTNKPTSYADLTGATNARREIFTRLMNGGKMSEEQAALAAGIPLKERSTLKAVADFFLPSFLETDRKPDFERFTADTEAAANSLITRPGSAPSAEPRSTFTPQASAGETHDTYLKLKTATPQLDEGALRSRAEELSRILPTLDRSSELAFYTGAKRAGLSKIEAATFWGAARK